MIKLSKDFASCTCEARFLNLDDTLHEPSRNTELHITIGGRMTHFRIWPKTCSKAFQKRASKSVIVLYAGGRAWKKEA